jgi:hypothetical protein
MRKPKRDFRYALRKSLLQKMDIKMPKTDFKLEEDPFLRLGEIDLFLYILLYRVWHERLL